MKTNMPDLTIARDRARAELHGVYTLMTVEDLALIREAVLTVIDEGGHRNRPWQLYENATASSTDYANEQRLDFCDAIQNYITDRLVPELKRRTR